MSVDYDNFFIITELRLLLCCIPDFKENTKWKKRTKTYFYWFLLWSASAYTRSVSKQIKWNGFVIVEIERVSSKRIRIKTNELHLNFYWLFSNTIEVTLRPVWPPNWNVGVGKTARTLKWLEKKACSSASVQLQEVMKKSPLGLSMEATLVR